MDKQWHKVLDIIKNQISSPNFRIWFAKTKIEQRTNGSLIVEVPSAFIKNTLINRYLPIIEDATKQVYGKKTAIDFKVNPRLIGYEEEVMVEFDLSQPQLDPVVYGLNPKYTLQNFVVGLSNNLAYAAAQAVIANPGLSYNPLFIYGGTGVGKTHLMQAIGNTLIKKTSNLKIIYCSSEKFMNDFVEGIQNKRTGDFRAKYRACHLLLIDDVQFFSGRDSTQEEFFHTFNELHTKNTQIVLTSDRPPNEIQKLEERLKSRFQGGLMVDIQLPDFDTRLAILKAKCLERGQHLAEDCLTLIAENMPTNARELEGKLIQILQTAKLQNTQITADFVRTFLKTPPTLIFKIGSKKVISSVTSYFDIKLSELIGPSRKKEYVLPRQLTMYLLYEECSIPYAKIGDILGGRDHTTILHGVDKIRQAVKRDREIQRILIEVKQIAIT